MATPEPGFGIAAAVALVCALAAAAALVRAYAVERRATMGLAAYREEHDAAIQHLEAVRALHGVSVLEFSAPGELKAADAGFERATGQSAAGLAGRGWLSAVAPEDHAHLDAAWRTAAARRTPLDIRIRTRSSDGGVRRHRMRAEPFGDGQGWLAVLLDNEDLCGAEDARDNALVAEGTAHTAAMQITEDLLDHVSHEFRTPLSAIVGWAEVLRASWGWPWPTKSSTCTVASSTRQVRARTSARFSR